MQDFRIDHMIKCVCLDIVPVSYHVIHVHMNMIKSKCGFLAMAIWPKFLKRSTMKQKHDLGCRV